MSAIADVQAIGDINSRLRQDFNFVHQGGGIDDHSHADDRVLLGPQNSARDKL